MDNETMNGISVTVVIRYGRRSFSEVIDVEEYEEQFKELQSNGANPHFDKKTIRNYMRPIEVNLITDGLQQFNERDENAHFIYGYWECLCQEELSPINALHTYSDQPVLEVQWKWAGRK